MGSEAAPERRDTMTGAARLSDRDEAAAQAVARRIAALLKPELAEILRQVDIMNAKLDEMRALLTRHEEQHVTMKFYQCECGYKAGSGKEGAPAEVNFIDHLLEAFDPGGSNLGTDGQVHAELTGPEKRTCSCGFAAPDWPLWTRTCSPRSCPLTGPARTARSTPQRCLRGTRAPAL